MNFKQFSTSDNQWYDVPYYQHKTATDTLTLPAVIYPNDTSITVGIKGNTTQSGTPTPTNPVDVVGVGERTAQLWNEQYISGYYNSSGTFISANNQFCSKDKIPVEPNTTYWLGVYSPSSNAFLGIVKYASDGSFIERVNTSMYIGNGVLFTTDGNTNFININFGAYYGAIYKNDIMIAKSTTAKPYEPYGYKIPISSANTTTPVYLGEVQTTRRIRKYTFTGNETTFNCVATTDGQNYCVAYRFIDFGMTDIKDFDKTMQDIDYPIFISSHFGEKPNTNSDFNDIQPNQVGANSISDASNRYIIFCVSGLTTAAEYSAWFAQQYANGTPVEVYYILETETTGTVNEPLMKIGDYADTVSGITVPTITGGDIFDVETTIKPSEVELTYTGWHDSSVLEYVGGVVNKFNINTTWNPPTGQTATITVSGESVTITGKYYAYVAIPVTANETYTAKYSGTGDRVYVVAYRDTPFNTANMITGLSTSGTTINVGDTDTLYILFYSGDGTQGTTTYSDIMLVEGSTVPSEYHPYYEWV